MFSVDLGRPFLRGTIGLHEFHGQKRPHRQFTELESSQRSRDRTTHDQGLDSQTPKNGDINLEERSCLC